MSDADLLRAGLAVLLRCSIAEVDRHARQMVEADARVLEPVLTDDERRVALAPSGGFDVVEASDGFKSIVARPSA